MIVTNASTVLQSIEQNFSIQKGDRHFVRLGKFALGSAAKIGVIVGASFEYGLAKVGSMVYTKRADDLTQYAHDAALVISQSIHSLDHPFVKEEKVVKSGCWPLQTKTEFVEGPAISSSVQDALSKAKSLAEKNPLAVKACVGLTAAAILLYYFGPSFAAQLQPDSLDRTFNIFPDQTPEVNSESSLLPNLDVDPPLNESESLLNSVDKEVEENLLKETINLLYKGYQYIGGACQYMAHSVSPETMAKKNNISITQARIDLIRYVVTASIGSIWLAEFHKQGNSFLALGKLIYRNQCSAEFAALCRNDSNRGRPSTKLKDTNQSSYRWDWGCRASFPIGRFVSFATEVDSITFGL